MLRLTMCREDYIQINEDIRIVFLGGSKNHQRIMVDAPKDVKIVRGKAAEKAALTEEEKEKLPRYFPERKAENGQRTARI